MTNLDRDHILYFSRGMVDVHGDQFVAYFLPENETLRKRKRDQEEEKEYTEGDEWVTLHL